MTQKRFNEHNVEKWYAWRKRYKQRPEIAERLKEQAREYYRKNKVKERARYLLRHAVTAGRIVRGPCEVCGLPETHGHHDDYSKPFSVRWLCDKHHRELHGGFGPKAKGE